LDSYGKKVDRWVYNSGDRRLVGDNIVRNLFPNSSSKLEDSTTNLERMKSAKDSVEFKAAFTSFLSSARAITYALQKEGAHIEGFEDWCTPFRVEMQSDPLLRFIHEARIADFHRGIHELKFSTHIKSMRITTVGPETVVIGAEGPFRIINKGTPKEKRIPMKEGNYIISISIKNPPTQHLGKTINDTSPIAICELALQYFESLIYKAKARFNPK
jgi:hypothetical protein